MTKEGTTLGPYHLLRSLGSGVAGEVYLAEGPGGTYAADSGQSFVAVKMLAAHASVSENQELARQVYAASQLHDPHIIPIHTIVDSNPSPGIVTAYAPGGSLGDRLGLTGNVPTASLTLPLDAGIVARLVRQLAMALAHAHAVGLIHGDIHPNNIFVRTSPSGRPLAALGDFGQTALARARLTAAARGDISLERVDLTSLLFLAPELMRNNSSPATDQYELAAVAYFLLTGRPPVSATPRSFATALAQQQPAPPSRLNPQLSPATDAALARALAKDSTQRFARIDDFAQALDDSLTEDALVAGGGLTQEFASLGHYAATNGPVAAPVAPRPRSALPGEPIDAPLSLEQDSRAKRRLAILSIAALLLGLVSCALAFRVVEGGLSLPQIHMGYGAVSQPTANVTATVQANGAMRTLATLTASSPVFTDSLASNQQRWATDGKTVFFDSTGLNLSDVSGRSVVTEDLPHPLSISTMFVQATMTFQSGDPGYMAGLRFLVTPDSQTGTQDYYTFVTGTDGRYEVWLRHAGQWDLIERGFSLAIRTGLHVPNHLGVYASSVDRQIQLFVNGQFIAGMPLPAASRYAGAPTSGSAGLIVMDTGAQVSFSQVAVYTASTH